MSTCRGGLIQYFSLIAVFSLSACGGGNGSESDTSNNEKNACFDNRIYAANAATFATYVRSGRTTGDLTESGLILSTDASFNTTKGLLERQVTYSGTITQPGGFYGVTGSSLSYLKIKDSGNLLYGTVTSGRLAIQISTSYSPAYEDARSLLNPGEEITFSATGTQTRTGTGASGPDSFNQKTHVKFVGLESLVLPSGYYRACRYDVSVDGAPATKEWWYRSFVIRSESADGSILEMKSGTLNNVPI